MIFQFRLRGFKNIARGTPDPEIESPTRNIN